MFLFSLSSHRNKNFPGTEGALNKSLEINPKHVNSMSLLGQVYQHYKKDYAAAGALYEKVLLVDPKHVVTLENFALLQQDLGDVEKAGMYFKLAMDLDPVREGIVHVSKFFCVRP